MFKLTSYLKNIMFTLKKNVSEFQWNSGKWKKLQDLFYVNRALFIWFSIDKTVLGIFHILLLSSLLDANLMWPSLQILKLYGCLKKYLLMLSFKKYIYCFVYFVVLQVSCSQYVSHITDNYNSYCKKTNVT